MARFPSRSGRSGRLAPLLVAVGLGAGGMALIGGGGAASYGVANRRARPPPLATLRAT